MEIRLDESLPDVERYLDSARRLGLEDHATEFETTLRLIRRFVPLNADTRILEVGTGTGWFPLMCKQSGLRCKGLEISPQLIAYAKEFGRRYGLDPDIELGNLEEHDIGESLYDVVIANSVFEHIEFWERALERVCRALRPGGMMYFASTNKFSIKSHEYPMPFYGWMPDRMRYRFRIARHGPGIMKLGIDFNQFTYPQLRRAFRRAGVSRIYDRVDLAETDRYPFWKKHILRIVQRTPLLKHPVLAFCDATAFICVK